MIVKKPLSVLNIARQTLPPQVLWFQPPSGSLPFTRGKVQNVEGEMRWTINGVVWEGIIATEGDTISIEWLPVQ